MMTEIKINLNTMGYGLLSAAFLLFGMACSAAEQKKKIIGETAKISVRQANINYLARIDTGARITSIHATDLMVSNAAEEKKDNIGKEISFTTENENHQQARITTIIKEVAKVRNAQGVEYRYVVDLKLHWRGINKQARVNLRNRSAMSYKLLIGRNWLSQDFIVDVDKSEGIIK